MLYLLQRYNVPKMKRIKHQQRLVECQRQKYKTYVRMNKQSITQIFIVETMKKIALQL
mgnify:CR=1 FL=1